MDYILEGCREAFRIILTLDPEFLQTVAVSLTLATVSVLLAAIAGVPAGIWLALGRFRLRNFLVTVSDTLMSLPTVVVGLLVYSFLTRRGPLGGLNLLFTQSAIVIGQFILIIPIVVSLTVSAVSSLDRRAHKTAMSLGADRRQAFRLVISEARFGILAGLVSAFGRVFAEVGISMMLGGNIRHYTRTITTAIALETSKGEFALGIALGFVLLLVAFAINIALAHVKRFRKDGTL